MKPVDNISEQYTATSSGTLSGMRAMFPSASFTWKYSANTPSFVLENFHPPNGAPDCEECPACEAGSPQSGVIAPTRTRSPGLKSLTLLPTSWTMPTASCPRVRFSRGPMAPPTVWESEVQMRALVVLTIASFGPGRGMGFSRKPTWPIAFMTNAFMFVPIFALLHYLAYAHRPAYTRNRDRVHDLTSRKGNIVYSFPMRKYTLVRSQTRHSKSIFCHSWSTMCSR